MEEDNDNAIYKNIANLPPIKQLIQILNSSNTTNNLLQVLIENVDHEEVNLEFIIENQRGMKFFGIPLFSEESLVPLIDPSSYQTLKGTNMLLSYNDLNNYALPDLDWEWSWPNWYVLMFDDVDDQGWIYSKMFFSNRHWKGKYHLGNFVRRRVWIRMRNKKVPKDEDLRSRSHIADIENDCLELA
ncbi:uncharacterized protein PRCAT00003145001 [Priceomyces carsonii]|uniref:uncharacterized protein n=1 Tax=Priceomyces carsonii TaxID=28549 RepID=UPI002EDB548E|nr:unnamed protein product [Priceomyces carsonii]